MKLLFCCAHYWPSVGGVQEVIRQIAEHLTKAGHEVAVATSERSDRDNDWHNGVKIHQFRVGGSLAAGMYGEVDRYRKFVKGFKGDAILIKAAQQWSFDALWPVLDDIKARKVFVPCGFSGLYEPAFAEYFAELPGILRKFDHLIFYAQEYRDIAFAKSNLIESYSIIPNGASEEEFGRPADGSLRAKLGIAGDDFLFLTVGSPANAKGHREVAEAFAKMDTGGRNATLILNGSLPEVDRHSLARLLRPRMIRRSFQILTREGWRRVWERLFPRRSVNSVPDAPVDQLSGAKRTLYLDLPRADVVAAFLEADLFVFASKVEYSPLVLFEAAASGTPFVTVPVGNAAEIVRWTGGGWLCPADFDEKSYVEVSSDALAAEMERGMRSPELLRQLGEAGRLAWQKWFTWATIAKSYERVLCGQPITVPPIPVGAEMASTP